MVQPVTGIRSNLGRLSILEHWIDGFTVQFFRIVAGNLVEMNVGFDPAPKAASIV
jgi:hypothetical protein